MVCGDVADGAIVMSWLPCRGTLQYGADDGLSVSSGFLNKASNANVIMVPDTCCTISEAGKVSSVQHMHAACSMKVSSAAFLFEN